MKTVLFVLNDVNYSIILELFIKWIGSMRSVLIESINSIVFVFTVISPKWKHNTVFKAFIGEWPQTDQARSTVIVLYVWELCGVLLLLLLLLQQSHSDLLIIISASKSMVRSTSIVFRFAFSLRFSFSRFSIILNNNFYINEFRLRI